MVYTTHQAMCFEKIVILTEKILQMNTELSWNMVTCLEGHVVK